MKVGLIGLGNMGMIHYRVLCDMLRRKEIDDIEVYDINSNLRKGKETKWAPEKELIDWADAVVIATPTFTHGDLAKKVLEKKKPVFVEKPLVFEPMIALDFLGAPVFVGYIERYNPVVQYLKKHFAEFGEVLYVTTTRVNNVPQKSRKIEGIVRDLGVHDFDLLCWLFEDKPYVTHQYILKDAAKRDIFASIDFSINDIEANVRLSWIDLQKERQIDVYTNTCVVLVDLMQQEIIIFDRAGESVEYTERFKGEPALLEMRAFLKMAKCGKNDAYDYLGLNSLSCAREVMRREKR